MPLRYMPQTFKILITGENVALPCKLRWIEGTEVGVQFTGDPDYLHNIYDPHQDVPTAPPEPHSTARSGKPGRQLMWACGPSAGNFPSVIVPTWRCAAWRVHI